jgi:hypothetical protein
MFFEHVDKAKMFLKTKGLQKGISPTDWIYVNVVTMMSSTQEASPTCN